MNPDRSPRSGRPPVPPRVRSTDGRPAPPRREPLRASRPADHVAEPPVRPSGARPADGRRTTARGTEARGTEARATANRATEARATADSSRIRGAVAVAGVFLVTLAGAGIDSFVGVGLGRITLGALLGATTVATLVVRRRDLISVVIAPPLVFVAVAALNIALAPSATYSLPTVATLLIRGFPTMAMATAIALVLAVGRLITRR